MDSADTGAAGKAKKGEIGGRVGWGWRVLAERIPAVAWPSLPADARPSRFWHSSTPSNTLLLVWQNLLLDRRADSPASFRWELFPDGGVALACDLSRAPASNLAASVLTPGGRAEAAPAPGASSSLRWARLDPSRAGEDDPDGDGLSMADEVFLHGTDPYCADTDGDGLSDGEEARLGTDPLDPLSSDGAVPDGVAARLGGADPLSCPPGSTNTVWEHLFYTGTTNAPFAPPVSTEAAAVLRVSASGTGGGVLSVGGTSVPLLGAGAVRARTPAAPALFVPVVRGEDVPLVLRRGAGLAVSLDSDDFAFGVLPSPEAGRLVGRINFPNAAATPACVHDLRGRTVDVSLPVRGGASALACMWRGGDGVSVENRPPRAARVRARFPARERRTVAYTLAHPDCLFGEAERVQEVRFCPVPPDDDPPGPEPWDEAGAGGSGLGGGCFWCAAAHAAGGECDCPCHPPDGGEGADGDDGEPDGVCAEHGVPPARCAPLHEDGRKEAELSHERLSGVRGRLGWPGRFASVAEVAVNFYSTGDEVLELAADNDMGILTGIGDSFGHHAWHKQELFKGRGIGVGAGATDWSGWNIEENWLGIDKVSAAEAQAMSDADFRTNTVFYCYPRSMNSPTIPLPVRGAHLALGIPALTPAAGFVPFGGSPMLDSMVDVNTDGSSGIERPNGWPDRPAYPNRWLHSDMKDVPFFFNFKFYEKAIEKGMLK